MDQYRCYLLDNAGAIRGIETVAGIDDRHAVWEARELLLERHDYAGFELWLRNRKICVEARELI